MLSRRTNLALAALALALTAGLRHSLATAAEPGKHPWYVNDAKYLDRLVAKLTEFAKAGKCLPPEAVAKKISTDGTCRFTPAKPCDKALAPEEVYKLALPSVFAIGCVQKTEQGEKEYAQGWFASAWVLAADGVLVTNWHVFENPEHAHFGAANYKGEAFPVTDILAVNKKADIAVVKIDAKGLTPLPVAADPADVGSWVGVLSHPGHQWFTFTQGHVSRYTKNFGGAEENKGERWMSVTADYAGGSSGGPVLNRYGAVVGMAALTSNIDFEGDDPPPADEKKDRLDDPAKPKPDLKKPDDLPKPKLDDKPKPEEKPLPPESRVQMIVKLTVPAAAVRKIVGAAAVESGK
jgi:S1-C subfamily serine protease